MSFADEVRQAAEKWVLQNALEYGGTPNAKAAMGRLMADHPEWRSRAQDIMAVLDDLQTEIEAMDLDAQRERLEDIAPELLEVDDDEPEERELPPLEGAEPGNVVMRLAPFPSGPLHIGNARMAVLNDEYVKRYDGRLLLVFDDTIGSDQKQSVDDAFELIPDGLEWLGIDFEKPTLYKSDRIPLHYEWAQRLIEADAAYVCTCPTEQLRANREAGQACEHRGQDTERTLAEWQRMLDGDYSEGEAILRLKTDMQHPDPAFRDRVLMRISEREHPRVGHKYHVWPMLEFSWAVDDHLLGVTHILRGKDLVIEDMMEAYIWDELDLPHAHFGHFGMLRVAEAKVSKSKSLQEVRSGEYTGWDDPRTWSLQALRRRGIRPEAVREFILSFGMSQSDVEVPAENLYAANRKLVDPEANRYAYVADPTEVRVTEVPGPITSRAPKHPDHDDRGVREVTIEPDDGHISALVAQKDLDTWDDDQMVRLKDLVNLTYDGDGVGTYHSVDHTKAAEAPKVQWVKPPGVPCRVVMDDGSVREGVVEAAVLDEVEGDVVQFERFGFCRLEQLAGDGVRAVFAHR